MDFKFNVELNDNDYYEYNKFISLKSYYGKKQILTFRLCIGAIFLIAILINLIVGGFSSEAFIGVIPILIMLLIFELLVIPYFKLALKLSMKSIKRRGKLAYSQKAVLEFTEETFSEETEESRTENSYSSIERISVLEKNKIYIHISSMMSFILPFEAFENEKTAKEFLSFLETKCEKIKYYK